MIELNVDDFGCVADGRVLEGVSIDAGSAVLHVPEGGLRASDVGKNIAIPVPPTSWPRSRSHDRGS